MSPHSRQVAFANPALVKLENLYVLTPVADGTTEMTVTFNGQVGEGAREESPKAKERSPHLIQARRDAGVHAGRVQRQGGCHGAARGKDGFRLSLFGFDPDGDHYRLTRELNGRRINLAAPPPKACSSRRRAGRCPTPAAAKIKAEGDEYHQAITRWLEADAPHRPADRRTPLSAWKCSRRRPCSTGRARSSGSSCARSTATAPTAT